MTETNPAAILEASDLSRSYVVGGKEVVALNPLSLKISPGEFLVISGPSGSGKSTLLHLLSGMDKPTSGKLFFAGKSLNRLSNKELAGIRNRYFGFVFQTPHLLYDRTVLENVILPGRYSNGLLSDILKRAKGLLAYAGIEELVDRMPNTLSGGELQRVVFARSLVCNPKVIFADEPTGSLDQENSAKIIELLQDQAQRNRAVIMVTHDPQAILSGSRRIVLEKIRNAQREDTTRC